MNDAAEPTTPSRIAIIGAGPAGLTAAYHLVRRGVQTVIFEQDTQVGGLARTVEHNGFRFDIGGHRFFTKVQAVTDLWRSTLGAAFLKRTRNDCSRHSIVAAMCARFPALDWAC